MIHRLATRALRGFDPEDAHGLAIAGLKLGLGPRAPADPPILATELAGMALPNPVGLAPGFDKNAEVFGPMLAAGFGFVECGTVTPKPQAGNPRPRLFRLSEDRAVINRMGFNNAGLEAFAARLARRGAGVVGANLGANKDSEDRLADYTAGLRRLWGMASYFTINISSPNTPGLRALQTKAALDELLGRLVQTADALPQGVAAPMFLKVAPDLEDAEIEAIAETVAAHGLAGVIVSNTTVARPPLRSRSASETGGLSGAPLMGPSTAVLSRFREAAAGRFLLVGVGGIASGADAYAKIRAGAAAVQLYSALVFEGPGLVTRIKRDLAAMLQADGFRSVAEAAAAR
ncbi:quinone-dependent dihydroorotate dehydrogenase [Phenylobacterium sp.]|uniref:quinone-dependent dihydroorotate dehydrogenase n=1 Tax=Phenylobacterium sp. TaxID=1871053 RepID=UPI0025E9E115|nr:quinone-dependent dihydroorotate dehydrogenase [Phenylobacterium sp.]MBX3482718.1 quinone-dependent dihydroorotate dehydrogenase [Phenylobacterium sp.]MCW5760055.1 quinone-dependent dihydroorotate dehydrogenase [Phenylobacterium sp.]